MILSDATLKTLPHYPINNALAKIKSTILTCAVTGGNHAPTMSPHLPITTQQIAQQSIAAVEAGASIIHLHARPLDRSADIRSRGLHAVPADHQTEL